MDEAEQRFQQPHRNRDDPICRIHHLSPRPIHGSLLSSPSHMPKPTTPSVHILAHHRQYLLSLRPLHSFKLRPILVQPRSIYTRLCHHGKDPNDTLFRAGILHLRRLFLGSAEGAQSYFQKGSHEHAEDNVAAHRHEYLHRHSRYSYACHYRLWFLHDRDNHEGNGVQRQTQS